MNIIVWITCGLSMLGIARVMFAAQFLHPHAIDVGHVSEQWLTELRGTRNG